MPRQPPRSNFWTRRTVALLCAGVLLGGAPVAAQDPADLQRATALLMVEDRGCPYCQRFDTEARDAYVNSPEGKRAPLVRRQRGARDIAFIERIVYSPTFVLLVDGREIGRIVGYQGSDLFWMEMSALTRRAGLAASER